MAGKILADVFFREGKHVLCYATYGGARRGSPVMSSLRVDDKPIRLRCDIDTPDVVVCFDPSLLAEGNLLDGATSQTRVLVNSARPAEDFCHPGAFEVVTIDGRSIARKHQLGRIVNTALVGAVLGLLGYENVELMETVISETSPGKVGNNVAACMEGYRFVNEGNS